MKNIDKLINQAEYFCKLASDDTDEQSADHYGVDPETGSAIKPEFETGDTVKDKLDGRLATYISLALWASPDMSIVHYEGNKIDKPDPLGGKAFNFHYVPTKHLKLVNPKIYKLKP